MKIAVCIKQVPASNEVMMDQKKEILIREGIDVKINPYDLVAIEAALQMKEKYQEIVTSMPMGSKSANETSIW